MRLHVVSLLQYKFKHIFLNIINSIYSCGNNIAAIEHLFLHCPMSTQESTSLLYTSQYTDPRTLTKIENNNAKTTLSWVINLRHPRNAALLNTSFDFINLSWRFEYAVSICQEIIHFFDTRVNFSLIVIICTILYIMLCVISFSCYIFFISLS